METITASQSFIHYADATYNYYCVAAPRTPLATAAWRISRINKLTLQEQWAASASEISSGDMNTNLATSLAVVAALTYI